MNTFIHQECIKLIKSDSKDIYNVKEDIYFKQKLFFWTLFIKESLKIKCTTVSTKIWSSTTVVNTDNNQKCFLSNDFWRSCDTEDRSNEAENSAAHHRNKLHFKIY